LDAAENAVEAFAIARTTPSATAQFEAFIGSLKCLKVKAPGPLQLYFVRQSLTFLSGST
jgi:hypothetical protein